MICSATKAKKVKIVRLNSEHKGPSAELNRSSSCHFLAKPQPHIPQQRGTCFAEGVSRLSAELHLNIFDLRICCQEFLLEMYVCVCLPEQLCKLLVGRDCA